MLIHLARWLPFVDYVFGVGMGGVSKDWGGSGEERRNNGLTAYV
jgi:hypothetical protein